MGLESFVRTMPIAATAKEKRSYFTVTISLSYSDVERTTQASLHEYCRPKGK